MNILYSSIFFIIGSVSMLSGLFIAPAVGTLFVLLLIQNYKKISLSNLSNAKLELILITWVLITCSWSIAGTSAYIKFIPIFLLMTSTYLLCNTGLFAKEEFKKIIFTPLLLGTILAIIIFLIEYKTSGIISETFRALIQKTKRKHFALYDLDRGCCVLSLLSWVCLYYLLGMRKYIFAGCYAIAILYILSISDSLAGFLCYLLAIVVFCAIYLSKLYLINLAIICVVIAATMMPIFANLQSPRELSDSAKFLPDSAKHRLFIWKFTSEKILEKPILGYGFNASAEFSEAKNNKENKIIEYNNYKWASLPLHPHNNFMQIFFECGIIGIILFTLALVKQLLRIKTVYNKERNLLWSSCAVACFANYLAIGMISYSMWQMWWLGMFSLSMLLFSIIIGQQKIEPNKV